MLIELFHIHPTCHVKEMSTISHSPRMSCEGDVHYFTFTPHVMWRRCPLFHIHLSCHVKEMSTLFILVLKCFCNLCVWEVIIWFILIHIASLMSESVNLNWVILVETFCYIYLLIFCIFLKIEGFNICWQILMSD